MSDAPVLIAAGGTGGHVYPALAVAETLRQRNIPVVWMGTREGLEARVVPAAGFDMEWVSVAGLRGKNLLQTLTAPLKLLHACYQAWRIFSRLQPRAVLGMGGFVAGPGCAMAVMRRCPLFIHEQNSVAGMTNRYMVRFARQVYTAFPGVFSLPESRLVETIGNPVRGDIASLMAPQQRYASRSGPLRLLVVGGSRGARFLNQTLPTMVATLSDDASGQTLLQDIVVRHQSGADDEESVRQAYQANGINAEVTAFMDDIAAAYGWADLVVCRAGAMTVSELAAAGVASVLVPFPYAVDDHQSGNARWLSEQGAAVLYQQSEPLDTLLQTLRSLCRDRNQLQHMAVQARSLYLPGAEQRMAQQLAEVAA